MKGIECFFVSYAAGDKNRFKRKFHEWNDTKNVDFEMSFVVFNFISCRIIKKLCINMLLSVPDINPYRKSKKLYLVVLFLQVFFNDDFYYIIKAIYIT